jgi:hypothetical protein
MGSFRYYVTYEVELFRAANNQEEIRRALDGKRDISLNAMVVDNEEELKTTDSIVRLVESLKQQHNAKSVVILWWTKLETTPDE